MDFVLWKGARVGEPSWESPWGPGPGPVGTSNVPLCLDLPRSNPGHTWRGPKDLIFPHHENEIAQSEASTGEAPFSRYWVHNGCYNSAKIR
ncbi:MAG: hypothetical protein CM1200mP27_12280 [Chloroflexota bacterium]|nr:MAG: hypothetical protein CM1200mP27_12280 [Chloroflexota bacterium]